MSQRMEAESAFVKQINRLVKSLSNLLPSNVLFWLLALIVYYLFPIRYAFFPAQGSTSNKKATTESDIPPNLFPSIDDVSIDHETPISERKVVVSSPAHPQPCSTGLTTRLLPFKNAKGEIEWAFTDDLPLGTDLDSFESEKSKGIRTSGPKNEILSPVTSNSSNADSILSNQKQSGNHQIDTPSSTNSDYDKQKDEQGDGEEGEEDDLEGDGAIEGESAEDGQYHQCPHCDSKFKMRGYLTRHLKKHSLEKAYRCPFRESSVYVDEHDVTHQCHPTGGFSRRDTYKTHLKSRHFKYPEGVPAKKRAQSPGNCSMCGEWFENGEIWCEIHIEGGECRHLPQGFKGKSRIKNRLKKQMKRMMKEKKKRSQYIGNPIEQQSPIMSTPSSINTPIINSAYDYNNSPTTSVSSSIGTHQTIHNSHDALYKASSQLMMPIQHHHEVFHNTNPVEMDYDDDYCLDTDQLSTATQFRDVHMYPMTGHMQSLNGYS